MRRGRPAAPRSTGKPFHGWSSEGAGQCSTGECTLQRSPNVFFQWLARFVARSCYLRGSACRTKNRCKQNAERMVTLGQAKPVQSLIARTICPRPDKLSEEFIAEWRKGWGNPPCLRRPTICTRLPIRRTFVGSTPGSVIEACGMGRWMRQIWVVIGLTVILTFPVTVAETVTGGHGPGSSHGGYQSKEEVAQLTADPPRR